MMKVTENEDKSLTISWDENDNEYFRWIDVPTIEIVEEDESAL